MIFDEIQWIAKEGGGFVGALKDAWVDWQRSGNIKVVICGSSNKFFADNVCGGEKLLRGMQTQASIWLKEFSIEEVRKYCLPNWSLSEVCTLYMMIGGVPHYLERVEPDLGFVHAVDKAFFTGTGNLLDELDEILDLDFIKTGKKPLSNCLPL